MCVEFSKVERKVEQFAYMKFLNWVEDGDLKKMPPPTGWERDEKYDCLEIVIKRVNLVAGISQDACDIYINGKRFIDVDPEANTVSWSQIGKLEPGKLGPYTFEKGQYEHVINHGNAAYLTAYCYANGLKGLKKNKTKMLEMLRQAILFGNQQAMALLKRVGKD